ncbi:hypothetical protein Droror1_Dr00021321 [Drosera rotundifolia]
MVMNQTRYSVPISIPNDLNTTLEVRGPESLPMLYRKQKLFCVAKRPTNAQILKENMGKLRYRLNLLVICILACVISTSSSPILCHDIERSALLSFKQSFSIDFSASIDPSSYPKTLSWKPTVVDASTSKPSDLSQESHSLGGTQVKRS